ncbi:MAG TPA: acetyl-CoA decarbonylase/synthase complex subunit gamma [Spirochaetota bacterium]|nr:acetyl-CoA decarbonylase/synthase complex subunit gamma [Spirochaetota bacterium]
MALTGLQIQKLLPGTNCKECGSNTCLAFAMKLAGKKADLSECPYASDEAKQVLGAATEPPVKTIAFGPDRKLLLGDETVLYRHEKTFVNGTLFAVNINDTDPAEKIDAQLRAVNEYLFERVGESFRVDMVAVTGKGAASGAFPDLCEKAWKTTGKPLVIRTADTGALKEAAARVAGSGSVICVTEASAVDELLDAAKEHGHALALTAPDADSLLALTGRLRDGGFTNILMQFDTNSLAEQYQMNFIARRGAIKDGLKAMGFPFLRFVDTGDLLDDTIEAITEVTKYGGICVLPYFDAAQMASLMTLRLNIFTDPQKPIQVEPKVYPVGEPDENSPVFLTTNFSLTFFVVSGEIENSGKSAWLAVPECEGMSVLTAWAAGKFNADSVAKFIKQDGLEGRIKSRTLIIPGYVSQISGELEDNLPGWTILVGPQEASDLEGYIKSKLAG